MTVKTTVTVGRKICGYFHRTDTARQKFKALQIELKPDKLPLKLIQVRCWSINFINCIKWYIIKYILQDVATRWNSTFDMLNRLQELDDAIVLFASRERIKDWNNMQWDVVPKLIAVLQPFKEVTVKVTIPIDSL